MEILNIVFPPTVLCSPLSPAVRMSALPRVSVSPHRSGLHRDAVWPRGGGHLHAGLQLPHVCPAGLRHRPVELRQQAGLRVTYDPPPP